MYEGVCPHMGRCAESWNMAAIGRGNWNTVGETGELENWDMENWRTKRCRGRGHHTEVGALSWRCGAGQGAVVRNGVIKTRQGRVGENPGWLSRESGPARLLGAQAGTGKGDWQAGKKLGTGN